MEVDRRGFVLTAASAVLLTKPASSYAQAIDKSLLYDLKNASVLQSFAIEADTDKDFDAFVSRSFFARQQTVLDAAKIFANVDSAQSYLNALGKQADGIPAGYFEKDSIAAQIQVVSFVSAAEVPLVPDVRDIQPIGVPVVEPVQKKTEDTDLSVILDIVLQTMGIFEGKTLSDELLKDPDVAGLLKEIAPSIKDKDWGKLIRLVEKMLGLIIASKAIKLYAEHVARRVAFRLSLRCVPIVGWIYVSAAFIIAIKANYHRFSFA